jgi:hypothetical protein
MRIAEQRQALIRRLGADVHDRAIVLLVDDDVRLFLGRVLAHVERRRSHGRTRGNRSADHRLAQRRRKRQRLGWRNRRQRRDIRLAQRWLTQLRSAELRQVPITRQSRRTTRGEVDAVGPRIRHRFRHARRGLATRRPACKVQPSAKKAPATQIFPRSFWSSSLGTESADSAKVGVLEVYFQDTGSGQKFPRV